MEENKVEKVEEAAAAEDEFNFDEFESQEAEGEKVVLHNDLEGFAKGFPDWDLHPPMKKK